MSKELLYIELSHKIEEEMLADQIVQQLEPLDIISLIGQIDGMCRIEYGDDYTELFDEWLNERNNHKGAPA